jgi:hypothetical protein
VLARLVDLTHVDVRCLARFRETRGLDRGADALAYDEVRLACSPKGRIPGLRTIELALATLEPGAPAALPEIFVRFDDASEAASKIAQLAPGVRIVPGRSPEEKVLRLSPRVPTPAGAARLLARLTVDLEGRRATDRVSSASSFPNPPCSAAHAALKQAFVGIERRAPRPSTTVAPEPAPVVMPPAIVPALSPV